MSTEVDKLREQVRELRGQTSTPIVLPKADHVYEGMSVEEYRELTLLYGDNIKQISECRTGMMNRLNYVQNTVKIMYALDYDLIKKQYQELTESNASLRTAYFTTKHKKNYKVQLKTQTESIRFYDLSAYPFEDAMNGIQEGIFADRRKGFRLEREPLVRVLLFKVNDHLHYALISQVCEDDGSEKAGLIIRKLFGQYLVYKEGRDAQDAYKAWNVNEERYWKNYLEDLGKRQYVPGYIESDEMYRKGVCRMISDSVLYDALCTLANRTHATVNDILECAWAILLHRYYQEEDILFGAAGSREGSGITPIRAMLDDRMKCTRLIMNMNERNQGMLKHGDMTITQIEKGLALGDPLINHLLSFSNMSWVETTRPQKGNSNQISVATYTEERWDFCLHVRIISDKVAFNCIYNQSCYEAESIQAVLDTYMNLLIQMTEDEQKTVGEYRMIGFDQIEDHKEEKEKLYLLRVLSLSRHPIFGRLPIEELEKLALSTQTMQCAEYDVLLTEGEEIETVVFITEGSVKMSKTGRDGWERPILLLKKDQMLTGQWILEDKHASFTMTANSMDTTLMLIPIPVMLDVMGRYPDIARAFFTMEHDRYMKVVRLWMNAD